jgi:ribosome-binding factor A
MKQTAQSRKINEVLRMTLADLLITEVSDPRLTLINITEVQVTSDRSHARIYVAADKERYGEVEAGLASAKGRIRSLLAQKLTWRVTPELEFVLDTGIDYAQSIDEAIRREDLRG